MPEGEAKPEPKKTLKPKIERKNPLVKAGPAASAEKRAFARIARSKLKEAHAPIEAKREVMKAGERAEAAHNSAEALATENRISELERSLVAGLPQTLREIIEQQLTEQRARLVEQREAEKSEAVSDLEQDPTFVEKGRHPELFRQVEQEMRYTLEAQRSIERLFDVCRGYDGGWTPETAGLKKFASFLEHAYLEEGMVERRILEQYLQSPALLSKEMRGGIERGLKILAEKEVEVVRLAAEEDAEASIPTTITDPVLRKSLRDRLVQAKLAEQNSEPSKPKELIAAYLASEERPTVLVDLQSPDAAMCATREVTLAKGALAVHDVRYAAATMLMNPYPQHGERPVNLRTISDEDRVVLLRYRVLFRMGDSQRTPGELEELRNIQSTTLDSLKLHYLPDAWKGPYEVEQQFEVVEQMLSLVARQRAEMEETFARRKIDDNVREPYTESVVRHAGLYNAHSLSHERNMGDNELAIVEITSAFDKLRGRVAALEEASPADFTESTFVHLIEQVSAIRNNLRTRTQDTKKIGNELQRLHGEAGNVDFSSAERSVYARVQNLKDDIARVDERLRDHKVNSLPLVDKNLVSEEIREIRTSASKHLVEIEAHMKKAVAECNAAGTTTAREKAREHIDRALAQQKRILEAAEPLAAPIEKMLTTIYRKLNDAEGHFDKQRLQYENDELKHRRALSEADSVINAGKESLWKRLTDKSGIETATTNKEQAVKNIQATQKALGTTNHTLQRVRWVRGTIK